MTLEAGQNEHAQRKGLPSGEVFLSRACPSWRAEPRGPALATYGSPMHFSTSPPPFNGIMSTLGAKLDYHVTRSKQATSQFLIDNFCTHLRRQASKSTIVRSADYCHSPARRSLGEGGSLACPPQHLPAEADRTSDLGFLNSSSNRPSPRLEMPVSHRKQTTGPISNRPNSTVCKFAVLRSLIRNSKLSTLDSQLRASHV